MQNLHEVIKLLKELPPETINRILEESNEESFVTLEELIAEHKEVLTASLSAKYATSHESSNSHLINYFNNNPKLSEVTERSLQLFLTELIKKVPSGWAVYLRNYKVLFNYAVQRTYLSANPFTKLVLPKKQKKLPAYLSVEELDAVIQQVSNETIRKIFVFAFYTGLRRGEIINVRWKHIDMKNETIIIGDENFITKTRKPRMIPMHSVVKQMLEELKPITINANSLLFKKDSGCSYSYDYLTHRFKKAVISAGLDEKLHFHSLRHSTASNMVQKGVSLYVVKDLLGHGSIATTEIYAHLNQTSLRAGINLIQ